MWEYRSPSKSVPPHYQCKLCQVTRLQNDMLAHVKGWKHCFRYMVSDREGGSSCLFSLREESFVTLGDVIVCFQKRNHPDKVPFEEDAALKDPSVRKTVKETAAEVEKAEGRGQLRVSNPYLLCLSHRSVKIGWF